MAAFFTRHLLLALLGLVLQLPAGAATQTVRRLVAPGLEYIHERQADGPRSIHIVKVDLAREDLRLVVRLANDVVLGREKVRERAARLPPSLGQPVAAVNGDSCETGKASDPRYEGTLEGLHIGRGELVHGLGPGGVAAGLARNPKIFNHETHEPHESPSESILYVLAMPNVPRIRSYPFRVFRVFRG